MPAISLVVCLYRERTHLERLLKETEGCYDDLVVVHDGREMGHDAGPLGKPAAIDYAALPKDAPCPVGYESPPTPARPGSIHALVQEHGGHFFEGGRSFQQEPHWPFAWWQARHDWILRLDADEFPSAELRAWLQAFRLAPEPTCAGFTCIWPLWDGRCALDSRWPGGRVFLLNRTKARFFGMVEQMPIPDTRWKPIDLVLHHQPVGKSYGIRNILLRRQAYRWRREIARSLMDPPTDLPCWRWTSVEWPEPWKSLRRRPLRHGISALVRYPFHQSRSMHKAGLVPNLSAALNPALHHFMLGLRVQAEKLRNRSPRS